MSFLGGGGGAGRGALPPQTISFDASRLMKFARVLVAEGATLKLDKAPPGALELALQHHLENMALPSAVYSSRRQARPPPPVDIKVRPRWAGLLDLREPATTTPTRALGH